MPLLRFNALWAINADLDPAALVAQLDAFVESGLTGVVFHPRNYTNEPPYLGDRYLEIVSDVVDAAAARGLEFWIYDENGWPSGTVDGRMLPAHPHLRQSWVERWPSGESRGGALIAEIDGWEYRRVEGDGVDYLNRETADRFLELCYQRYAEGMRPESFARVRGFFSDEPELGLGHAQHLLSPHGAVPWTGGIPAAYAERHAADIVPRLPELFGEADGAADTRIRFWELVTDLFADDYLARLDTWCSDRGLVFTAHVKGEEHPFFQVPTSGSLGPVARRMALPGVDALGREPGNDFFPRLVSSVSRQFGTGRAMAEAFGGSGWGSTPADLERYLLWLGRNGVTDFVLHISQYVLDTAAIEDWPPSQPLHLSWRAAYASVLDAVVRQLPEGGREAADTLVVIPQRGIQAAYAPAQFVGMNVHDARDYAGSEAGELNGRFLSRIRDLTAAGVAFDLVDERTLGRDGRRDGNRLFVGDQAYERVEVAAGAILDPTSRALIAGFPARRSAETVGYPRGHATAPSIAGVDWALREEPVNELPLEAIRQDDGSWSADFEVGGFRGACTLVFADPPGEVRLNGRLLTDDRLTVSVERSGVYRVAFGGVTGPRPPRAWVRGVFRVDPASPYARPRGRIVEFDSGFRLEPPRPELRAELSTDGFPFLFETLRLRASINLRSALSAGWLIGGRADAAWIGERWHWGEGWLLPPLGPGRHDLDIDVVPNSLNRFGPFHYFSGDPLVVSPAQMSGERNYADADGAPAQTHVDAWMLRRLRLPTELAVLPTSVIDTGAADPYSIARCESIHIPTKE